MKSLVTGSSGFVGYNLTKRLVQDGWKVFFTGRDNEQDIAVFDQSCYLGYQFNNINWKEIGKIDVLFHQAAITDTTISDEKLMMDVNTHYSLQLFEQAIKHGCQQIVYASSCATYGNVASPFKENGPTNPLNIYGKSKLELDKYINTWKVNVVGLRYSNVYGPYEDHKGKSSCMISQIGTQMLDGPPRLFEYGCQKRDFVYIKDIVNYNLAAAKYPVSGIFNAGSGVATSFNEVVEIFNDAYNKSIVPIYVNNPYHDKYQEFTLCDMSKTSSQLGIRPEWSIKEAVQDYMEHLHYSRSTAK
jgi:ADP-L-glycero-D-manno-heptose 6-epimerase